MNRSMDPNFQPSSGAPSTVAQRVSLPVDNRVEALLLWRVPLDSLVVLLLATAAYVFLVWSNRSLVSLLATLAAITVGVCFVWSNLAAFLNKPGPPMPRLLVEGVSETSVKNTADQYTPMLNRCIALAHRMLTGKDVVLTGKVLSVLYVVSRLGKVFSVLTWAYVVVLLSFSIPKLYELKKPEIDRGISQASNQAQRFNEQYVAPSIAKIPRGSTSTQFQARPGQSSMESDVKRAL